MIFFVQKIDIKTVIDDFFDYDLMLIENEIIEL